MFYSCLDGSCVLTPVHMVFMWFTPAQMASVCFTPVQMFTVCFYSYSDGFCVFYSCSDVFFILLLLKCFLCFTPAHMVSVRLLLF